jgi:Helix-turn-helix of DDE superfamily endonuclease
MSYWKLKGLGDEDFRRLSGILHATFRQMVKFLKSEEEKKLKRGGRKPSKSMEERLLMTLEYWREYRTYFHVAASYNTSEPSVYRYIRWIEDTLIKSNTFSLPGRKALLQNDLLFEVVMVDATESPCERPKKSRSASTPARKSGTPRKPNWS